MLNHAACYKALQTRDERFDGRIFVGVTTTGIYCRPVCPAGPPLPAHCRFFPSAAAAQDAGFRPCLRCRPETAVDLGSWRGTSNTVSRGLALIAEGELDRDDASIDGLAERLGVGGRQLRRLFQQHLGASPIAVAQTRRVLFAKQLIHETSLPLAEIALAAGFGSVRRFNETFRALFQRPPSALRRKGHKADGLHAGVSVRLRYRAPYDWASMLAYLRARAIDDVERVTASSYARVATLDGALGTLEVTHAPDVASLEIAVRFPSVRALPLVIARVRRVFDLGADVVTIGAHLSRDPMLAKLVAARPGLRAPGGWDGFELALRAVLGQQVSVESGRRLAGKLVQICGSVVHTSDRQGALGLIRAFPTAEQVAGADLQVLGMPASRREALLAVARVALSDPEVFHAQGTVEETVARLLSIPGVGEWTAQYIALRAAREPDAFPATDVGLLRAATRNGAARMKPRELLERAEPWRPWRGYAAQHLWAADGARPADTKRRPASAEKAFP